MMKQFKKCPMCKAVWKSREEFIGDTALVLDGYQVNFDYLHLGLFYFTHNVEGCFSTMAMPAAEFVDLNPATPHFERKTNSNECPAYCLHKDNLQRCPLKCECAFVRDVLGIIQQLKTDPGNAEVIATLSRQAGS